MDTKTFDKTPNPIVERAFEQLKEAFGETPKGEFVPWSEIDAAMGLNHLAGEGWRAYLKLVAWTKKNRRIVLHVRQGAGVLWADDRDVAGEIITRRQRRAYRQINRGIRDANLVDGSKLPLHERRAFAMKLDGMKYTRLVAGRQAREAEKAAEPTPTIPQRPKPN